MRRLFRLYRLHFRLPLPQPLLLDGTFLHAVTALPFDALARLPTALGVPLRSLTTRCVREELYRLGEPLEAALRVSLTLPLTPCRHKDVRPAVECVRALIGNRNAQKFLLATQDESLQELSCSVPQVPIVCVFRKQLLQLRKPPPELRAKLLRKESEKDGLNRELRTAAADIRYEQKQEKWKLLRKERQVTGLRLKKRAHGPNPLSCKRSQKEKTI